MSRREQAMVVADAWEALGTVDAVAVDAIGAVGPAEVAAVWCTTDLAWPGWPAAREVHGLACAILRSRLLHPDPFGAFD